MDAGINEVPGQDLVLAPLPQGIEIHGDPGRGGSLLPAGELPGLQPAVKTGAPPVGFQNEAGNPPVSSRQDPFQIDHLGIVPAVLDTPVVAGGIDRMIHCRRKAQIVSRPVHGCPLERSKGLGDKKGSAHGDPAPPAAFLLRNLIVVGRADPVCQLRDLHAVLLRLRGQAQHKVEFHPAPAASERLPRPGQDLLLRDAFVDHIPQAL